MAHFARLNDQNKVTQVVVVNNDVATDEAAGVAFLKNIYGQNTIWKQTSYNTQRGVHLLGGTPFRKNHAAIGYTYDEDKDAFIPPKPTQYPSWVLNETTCQWEPPIQKPSGETPENRYGWNESTQQWDVYTHTYVYNEETQQWDVDNS